MATSSNSIGTPVGQSDTRRLTLVVGESVGEGGRSDRGLRPKQPSLPFDRAEIRRELLRRAVRDLSILALDESIPAGDRDKLMHAASVAGEVTL